MRIFISESPRAITSLPARGRDGAKTGRLCVTSQYVTSVPGTRMSCVEYLVRKYNISFDFLFVFFI